MSVRREGLITECGQGEKSLGTENKNKTTASNGGESLAEEEKVFSHKQDANTALSIRPSSKGLMMLPFWLCQVLRTSNLALLPYPS